MTEREKTIAESTLGAFWSLDADYRFMAVSPTTRKLLGYQHVDLLALNLLALQAPPEQTRKLPAKHFVEFRITDSGPGISEEHRQSILDRFYQVETSLKKNEPSNGLGLAICKAIVEAHGGKIDVDSTLDKGASFWFQVPGAT